jgi:DNA-binding response OmpR family regulator
VSAGPTVLLIDDEPSVLRGITHLLRARGYTVLAAAGGDAAVRIAAAEHVDLTVVDFRLPGWRGDVVLVTIMAFQVHLLWRSVFISGDITDGVEEIAEAMGVPLVLKPFDVEELEWHFRRLLSREVPLGRRQDDVGGVG